MLILVLVGLREAIMNAIPDGLKRAIGAGIGLFIALIGFVDGGIVIHPEGGGTIVALNDHFRNWGTFVFVLTLLVAAVMMARKIPGALLIAIVVGTVAGMIVNGLSDGTPVAGATWPHKVFATPDFGSSATPASTCSASSAGVRASAWS